MKEITMPAARPSQAQITNVIAALQATGVSPGVVRVAADGSFSIEIASAAAKAANDVMTKKRPDGPRKFGEAR